MLQERLSQQDIKFSVAIRRKAQSQTIGLYRHLARTTGGATYNIDAIRRNSRQHIHDVTQSITETVMSSRTVQCRQCTCQSGTDGPGNSQCHRVPC